MDEIDNEEYRARCDAENLKIHVSAETSVDNSTTAVEDFVPHGCWTTERFVTARVAPATAVFPSMPEKRADKPVRKLVMLSLHGVEAIFRLR